MSNLSESCTLDEVYQAIGRGAVLYFCGIPQQHQTESVTFAWFEKIKVPGSWLQSSFDDIPSELRTPQLMLLAAKRGCSVLNAATPEQYPNYRELALASIEVNACALADLDSRFRTEEMFERAQARWPALMFVVAKTCDWLLEAMSDELLDKSARGDPLLALIAPQDRLREPLHYYMSLSDLSTRMWACHVMWENGHLPMMASKVLEGEWFDGGFRTMEKPGSLDEAVLSLRGLLPSDDGGKTILITYIMSHPIDEVVPAMTGSLKKLLLEMYSADELKPFIKTDTGLRGVMLEGAMGL